MLLDKICPENTFHHPKQANFPIFCVVAKNNTAKPFLFRQISNPPFLHKKRNFFAIFEQNRQNPKFCLNIFTFLY